MAFPVAAQSNQVPAAPVILASYADLADLADSSPLVLRAELRKSSIVDPARATTVRPGRVRLYIEAKTKALLRGDAAIGEALRYLVDLPLDAKGKPPKLKKSQVLLFARAVAARPGELQLVTPNAQILWDTPTETKLRGILAELNAAGAPPRITAVREVIYVPGTLAGEGETQMFFTTANDTAAAITVSHVPGQRPAWGASFSEVVESAPSAPRRETLAWYRLACFLPAQLPRAANLSASPADKVQAEADYRLVLRDLGTCPRLRR